jgi:predicted small secreted protein
MGDSWRDAQAARNQPLPLRGTLTGGNNMKALLAAIVGASFLLLGGCNTVEGVGKDVKAGGSKVEQEAKEHKRY